MLSSIKQFFDRLAPVPQQSEEQKQHALQLAICVLLAEMSRVDGQVCPNELSHLNRLMDKQFDLTDTEKQELQDLANEELDDATDYYQFTSVINSHFTHSQKIEVVEHLWQIAYSDGSIDSHEEHFLRKVHSLLHVSHSDFIKAKLRAQSTIKPNNQ